MASFSKWQKLIAARMGRTVPLEGSTLVEGSQVASVVVETAAANYRQHPRLANAGWRPQLARPPRRLPRLISSLSISRPSRGRHGTGWRGFNQVHTRTGRIMVASWFGQTGSGFAWWAVGFPAGLICSCKPAGESPLWPGCLAANRHALKPVTNKLR